MAQFHYDALGTRDECLARLDELHHKEAAVTPAEQQSGVRLLADRLNEALRPYLETFEPGQGLKVHVSVLVKRQALPPKNAHPEHDPPPPAADSPEEAGTAET